MHVEDLMSIVTTKDFKMAHPAILCHAKGNRPLCMAVLTVQEWLNYKLRTVLYYVILSNTMFRLKKM